jgi:glycosyltransferase involved in cell wall biosynthesis
MPKHILFVSSWYPTPEKKSHGIFFKRHAESAALLNKISSIHICSGASNKIEVSVENDVYTIIGVYKKVNHSIPIIATIQKLWRSFRCFKKSYQSLISAQSVPNLVMLNVIFPAGIFVWWLHRFQKIPFIIQEQWSGYYPEDGNYKGLVQKQVTQWCAKHAKAIIVVSNKLEQSMQWHGLKNKYLKIGNVVDTNLFVPHQNKILIPFKFVHVSTVNDKEKNITGIIKAAEHLLQKNISFTIDIVGDGPERAAFEELAMQKKLLNNIIFFHGFQLPEMVAKIMANAHCFILNSNYEGLPCVLLEAMSCGIPVITTNVGAIPEIIDRKQGIIIEPNSSEALCNAMQDMVENYKEYDCVEIREIIIQKYAYHAIAKDFDNIFKSVLINE